MAEESFQSGEEIEDKPYERACDTANTDDNISRSPSPSNQLNLPRHHPQQHSIRSSTTTAPIFSPQDLTNDYDYDHDDIDLFPTGLTPDLSWIDLPISGPCPTDLDALNHVLNLSVLDSAVWNKYETSTSVSSSSMHTATPTQSRSTTHSATRSQSRSLSPNPARTAPQEPNAIPDVIQFINCGPDLEGEKNPEIGSNPIGRVTKRQLNTKAACRYRQRKVDRMNQLEEELELVKSDRDQLRMRVSNLAGETEGLKRLLDLRKL
ncbi:hypothetical protein BDW59DRAFT_158493 [Aspergillus cavernicola]|uniref:BZIP domain-containing protein n=1 Tax=Aspergillus cavernicola TaxID=176166 RepID=A0ABR4ISL1_9EURO